MTQEPAILDSLLSFPETKPETTAAPLIYPSGKQPVYACMMTSEEAKKLGAEVATELGPLALPKLDSALEGAYQLVQSFKSTKLKAHDNIGKALLEELKRGINVEIETQTVRQSVIATEAASKKAGQAFFELRTAYESVSASWPADKKARYDDLIKSLKSDFVKAAEHDARLRSIRIVKRIEMREFHLLVTHSKYEFALIQSKLSSESISISAKVGLKGPLTIGQIKKISTALDKLGKIFKAVEIGTTGVEIGYHTAEFLNAETDEDRIKAVDATYKVAGEAATDALITTAAVLAIAVGTMPMIAAGVGGYVIYLVFEDDLKKRLGRTIIDSSLGEYSIAARNRANANAEANARELRKLFDGKLQERVMRHIMYPYR